MVNEDIFPDIYLVENGYIASPAKMDTIKSFCEFDEWVQEHEQYNWDEYVISVSYVYPAFLTDMYKAGIPFIWEYQLTEDFSYYAYYLPTEDDPKSFVSFKTGDRRKKLPRLSKKSIAEIEKFSSANELIYLLGIKHGVN